MHVAAPPALLHSLTAEGFAFVHGSAMRPVLERAGALSDWAAFAASWDRLDLDTYLADQSRYRRRRHAVYSVGADGAIVRELDQPHYQSREYNALFGGIARTFSPIEPAVGSGATMQTVLAFCGDLFGELSASARAWRVEVHQFRIEARPGQPGQPTPEGVHRDGVDFVLVLLVGRVNIERGTTTVHRLEGTEIGSFTLTDPLDAALVDDRRVAHGVTPVAVLDPREPAYRDVLVVTFRKTD